MATESPELVALRKDLRAAARPEEIPVLQRFFKTEPGEYAEGDQFIAVSVPETRRVVARSDELPETDITLLLRSPIHEERRLGLLILVRRFQKGGPETQERMVTLFLREKEFINNWDLVDCSAPYLLGPWLRDRDRGQLMELIRSPVLWDRRIAVVATFAFIRSGDFAWTLRLAENLLEDSHDLMHKAVGWMLREVGKRDEDVLRKFLDANAPAMPRTMLRYAIEKFPAADRAEYLSRPRRGLVNSPRARALPSGSVSGRKRK